MHSGGPQGLNKIFQKSHGGRRCSWDSFRLSTRLKTNKNLKDFFNSGGPLVLWYSFGAIRRIPVVPRGKKVSNFPKFSLGGPPGFEEFVLFNTVVPRDKNTGGPLDYRVSFGAVRCIPVVPRD